MQEIYNYEDFRRSKTPIELNDGLDPEEEQQCYQGKFTSSDGVYIGTYSFFIYVFLLVISGIFCIWEIVPQSVASYIPGLSLFYDVMPDQFAAARGIVLTHRYWVLVIQASFILGFLCIVVGYFGVMESLVFDPSDSRSYTDGKRSEVTKKGSVFVMTNETIPPIEDCDANKLSELMFA